MHFLLKKLVCATDSPCIIDNVIVTQSWKWACKKCTFMSLSKEMHFGNWQKERFWKDKNRIANYFHVVLWVKIQQGWPSDVNWKMQPLFLTSTSRSQTLFSKCFILTFCPTKMIDSTIRIYLSFIYVLLKEILTCLYIFMSFMLSHCAVLVHGKWENKHPWVTIRYITAALQMLPLDYPLGHNSFD